MRSNREAKNILKAFGKEAYKERIKYVDSFMPEKTPFMKSISYRHTFRRVVTIALLVILIMALAVSAYAAIIHYLNYTKIIHDNNDEYIINDTSGNTETIKFYEPTFVPPGYTLELYDYDKDVKEKLWVFNGPNAENLIITQSIDLSGFHIDNEETKSEIITVGNMEGVKYSTEDDVICIFQYDNMIITIHGKLETDEIVDIIKGMNIPE